MAPSSQKLEPPAIPGRFNEEHRQFLINNGQIQATDGPKLDSADFK